LSNRYQVLVHGSGARIEISGAEKLVGFVATRIVDAHEELDARALAIKLVAEYVLTSSNILNAAEVIAKLSVMEVNEAGRYDDYSDTGLIFYSDEQTTPRSN
jgi:hypothetical protein